MRDASGTARPDAPVLLVCGLEFEARIAAGPGVRVVRGPGPLRTARQLDAVLAGAAATGILSFGCAGALDPALAAGTCVVATAVQAGATLVGTDPAWTRALLARLPQAHAGLLAGLDAPLATRAAKARLWHDSGALAVDMETHAAALAARRHGLPFAACRVVLDPAWRSLPSCALAAMREDGSTDIAALLRALAGAPGQLVPLGVLALDAWRARRALARLRGCLGPALAPP